MLSYSLRISHSINNWSYITGETKDWDVMKSGRYYVQEKGSICNSTISDREIWITGKEGVEMKKEDRKERYWEETNVAITCTTLKAQLAKYKKNIWWVRGKDIHPKDKKNPKQPKNPRVPQKAYRHWLFMVSFNLSWIKATSKKTGSYNLIPPTKLFFTQCTLKLQNNFSYNAWIL